MATVASHHRLLSSAVLATLVAATLAGQACGSSSRTETLTSPSASKCTIQATTDAPSFPAAGGTGLVRVGANRDCQWTVKADAAWLTIGQPADGQGDGSVRFTVGANSVPAARTGGIAVNDQRVEITQAAKPCEITVSSNHESVDSAGGNLSIAIRASADTCPWNASSGLSWISIVSESSGRGNGTVTLHVDSLNGPSRSGNVTIAGQNVQIDQGAGCSYTVGSDTVSLDAAGGERQLAVTTAAGCPWTAETTTPWITITGGATGSGPGLVVFRVGATDGPGRSGTLTVAGRVITVTQSLGCAYTISPSSLSVPAQGATTGVQVDAGAGCAWTAASAVAWVSIVSGANGSGRGQVQITVAANDGPARTGTITIAGRSLTVAQAAGCTYSIAPTSQAVGGPGGSMAVSVTTASGCRWSAGSSVEWISVTPASGAGSGQTTLTVSANPAAPRTGTTIIAGRTFTVSQASLCTWAFAPPSHELPSTGGTGNVLVFVSGACSWTAVPNVAWIQITAGGSGTGDALLQFLVSPNPGAAARTGLIALGGENYVVHEGGTGTIR